MNILIIHVILITTHCDGPSIINNIEAQFIEYLQKIECPQKLQHYGKDKILISLNLISPFTNAYHLRNQIKTTGNNHCFQPELHTLISFSG